MRVLIGPFNPAGQGSYLARGLRDLGIHADVLVWNRHAFHFPVDICVDIPEGTPVWTARRRLLGNFARILPRYDIFHLQMAKSLLPRYADLPVLRGLGKKIVMSYHGDDVRLREVARRNNPYFHLFGDLVRSGELNRRQMKTVARYADVAMVQYPELADYLLPEFRRVEIGNQITDVASLDPLVVKPAGEPLRVLHAPSYPRHKGTAFLEAALEKLPQVPPFEYVRLENMTFEQVKAEMRRADIIVDQLFCGAYGLVAVEAMALGKTVVCYIRDDLVERYPPGLPIAVATPYDVGEVIQRLLRDPDERHRRGREGRPYAENHHDFRPAARAMAEVYRSL